MTSPQEYKMVLSPSTDTDPPTAPIATWDNLIGINPPFALVKDLATPYDPPYGAVGDGVTDDTVAMQAWLDAIAGTAGYLQTGTFAISDGLKIHANTKIYGAGRNSANIVKLPGFPANVNMFLNSQLSSSPAPQLDNDIYISDVGFQGSSTEVVAPGAAMMQFIGVNRITFRDCLFQHIRRTFIVYSNCTNIVLDSCEFFDWGSLDPVVSPGQCLFEGGPAVLFFQANTKISIINCDFHDGQWGGISFGLNGGDHFYIGDGTRIRNVMEYGIFGNPQFGMFNGVFVQGVRRKDCSAQGFELGGSLFSIENCQIFDTDRASIYLTDAGIVNIVGNICNEAGQEVVDPSIDTGTITVLSNSGVTYPNNITITDNQISGRDFKSSYGIALLMFGSGIPMQDILVANNNLGPDTAWRGSPIKVTSGAFGTDCMIRDNRGAAAFDISTRSVNFLIPSGTSGSFTVPSIGFRPSWIELMAVLPSTSSSNFSVARQSWLAAYDVPSMLITQPFAALEASGIAVAVDGSNRYGEDTAGRSSISIVSPVGHPICLAAITAVDENSFTVTINSSVAFAAVNVGGSGYAVGDTGFVTGGDGTATYKVKTVSGGAVTALTVEGGQNYVTATGAATTTGGSQPGSGTGLTLNIYSSSPTTADVSVTATLHA